MDFSANLGFLWKERPFLERIAAARAAGFTLVEFHDQAQEEDLAAVTAALGDMGVVGLNAHMGPTSGCAAIAGAETEAMARSTAAIATARALGAKGVHVMAGRTDAAGDAERFVAHLREVAAVAPDLMILVEPICHHANPGYFVHTVEKAADLLDQAGMENIKIMFDCFHVQRAGGDVLTRFRTHFERIGHVQIAGGLTRREPDDGELNYAFLLPAIREAGYEGPFGCEYHPKTTVEEGLGWRDAFL